MSNPWLSRIVSDVKKAKSGQTVSTPQPSQVQREVAREVKPPTTPTKIVIQKVKDTSKVQSSDMSTSEKDVAYKQIISQPVFIKPVKPEQTIFTRNEAIREVQTDINRLTATKKNIQSVQDTLKQNQASIKPGYIYETSIAGNKVNLSSSATRTHLFMSGILAKRNERLVDKSIRDAQRFKNTLREQEKYGTTVSKTDSGWDISFDPKKWEAAEDARARRDKDYGYMIGTTLSSIFSPERVDYALDSLRSGTYDPKTGKTYINGEEINTWKMGTDYSKIQKGHYEYYKAYGAGDWKKIGIRVVSSPVALPLATSAAVKGGTLLARGVASGFKSTVAASPRIYSQASKTFPRVFDTTKLESGALLQTRSAAMVSKFGKTGFYKNIYGWSTNQLVRVRTLPMVGRPLTSDLGGGVSQTTTKYKGFVFRKASWEPRAVAYQTSIGKTGQASVQFSKSTYGHGFRSSAMFTDVSKPKGFLFKRMTVTDTYYSEFSPSPFSSPTTSAATDMWGGFIKPSSSYSYIATAPKYSFVGDTSASASLTRTVHRVPTHGSGMVRSGFITGLSAGSPYTISYPTMFTLPSLSNVPLIVSGIGLASKGLQSPSYSVRSFNISKPGYDITNVSVRELSQSYNQITNTDTIQNTINQSGIEQQQLQGSLQRQIQKQSLSYVPPSKYKAIIGFIPSTIPKSFKAKTIKPLVIPTSYKYNNKKYKLSSLKGWGKGYRFRDWNTISLKDFIGGK